MPALIPHPKPTCWTEDEYCSFPQPHIDQRLLCLYHLIPPNLLSLLVVSTSLRIPSPCQPTHILTLSPQNRMAGVTRQTHTRKSAAGVTRNRKPLKHTGRTKTTVDHPLAERYTTRSWAERARALSISREIEKLFQSSEASDEMGVLSDSSLIPGARRASNAPQPIVPHPSTKLTLSQPQPVIIQPAPFVHVESWPTTPSIYRNNDRTVSPTLLLSLHRNAS